MKTKLISFLFMLLLSLTTFAQQQQKKVAVYVTGQESGVSKVLGDQLVAAFTKSGKYIAIERTASFLAELSKEQSYQRSGAVSDNEISRLGIQFGVQFVCVVDVSEVFGKKYVSARLIDVEEAQVVNTANTHSPLSTMEELIGVCNTLKRQLFGDLVETSNAPKGYVDLGLPSGTIWKDKNEEGGLYTYEQALNKFGNKLPTKEQFEELKNICSWSWTGNGYKVTGPNGNSIFLPAAGWRCCHCENTDYAHSSYWSSTPKSSDGKYVWELIFCSDRLTVNDTLPCVWESVRLVQN